MPYLHAKDALMTLRCPIHRNDIKLANLELGGGSKAAILTTSVAQIHADFGHSVAVVRGSDDSDVMDLDDATAAFEENFQTFRSDLHLLLFSAPKIRFCIYGYRARSNRC